MDMITLFSGSGGNATLVRTEKSCILIDAGVSARRIKQALKAVGTLPEQISAILVTHEHIDHIRGIDVLSRDFGIPVYANAATWNEMADKLPRVSPRDRRIFELGQDFYIRDVNVQPFATPHDAICSNGYVLASGHCRFAVATDMGMVTHLAQQMLEGCQGIVLESNHDEEMLRRGPYPEHLKRRILGRYGHLSNTVAGDFALHLADRGAKAIVLAHLSKENNLPELAYNTVAGALRTGGVDPQRDLHLSVAPVDQPGTLIRME